MKPEELVDNLLKEGRFTREEAIMFALYSPLFEWSGGELFDLRPEGFKLKEVPEHLRLKVEKKISKNVFFFSSYSAIETLPKLSPEWREFVLEGIGLGIEYFLDDKIIMKLMEKKHVLQQ
jgi:hypothetical protein